MTGLTTDSTHDTLIGNKGTEADNWVVDKLTEIYDKSGKIAQLPVFSISGATVNGAAVPQNIKDLATNRTTYLCAITLELWDKVKEYKELVNDQLGTIERALQTREQVYTPAGIV